MSKKKRCKFVWQIEKGFIPLRRKTQEAYRGTLMCIRLYVGEIAQMVRAHDS